MYFNTVKERKETGILLCSLNTMCSFGLSSLVALMGEQGTEAILQVSSHIEHYRAFAIKDNTK